MPTPFLNPLSPTHHWPQRALFRPPEQTRTLIFVFVWIGAVSWTFPPFLHFSTAWWAVSPTSTVHVDNIFFERARPTATWEEGEKSFTLRKAIKCGLMYMHQFFIIIINYWWQTSGFLGNYVKGLFVLMIHFFKIVGRSIWKILAKIYIKLSRSF